MEEFDNSCNINNERVNMSKIRVNFEIFFFYNETDDMIESMTSYMLLKSYTTRPNLMV
jgi:3-phenylpropionate/cinnamic acid dioxygenase small subunit